MPVAGYAGNISELLRQLVVAFNAPNPPSLGETELYVDLINAVEAFSPGGGGGNAGWQKYTLTAASEPITTLFTSTTGQLITDEIGRAHV